MKKLYQVYALLLLFALVCGNCQLVTAAVAGDKEVVSKKYDVDGDGKKDMVSVRYSGYTDEDETGKMTLYLNEKVIHTESRKLGPSFDIQLYKLKSAVLIHISSTIVSDDSLKSAMYRYDTGKKKLKKIKNMLIFSAKNTNYMYIEKEKISGDSLTMTYRTQLYATGGMSWPVKFQYRNGKLNQVTKEPYSFHSAGKKFTANRSFKVYTRAGGSKEKFTVPAEAKVKIKKMKYAGKCYYLEITYKKKKGWIMSPKTYQDESDAYFKGIEFAG